MFEISFQSITYGLVGGVLGAVLYFVGRLFRTFAAYVNRESGPKERAGFYLPFFAVVGLVAGIMAYPLIHNVQECKAEGRPIGACLFIPEHR